MKKENNSSKKQLKVPKTVGKKKVIAIIAISLTIAGGYMIYKNSYAWSCSTLASGANKFVCYANYYASINTREAPAFSNKGSYINTWNTQAGGKEGDPWCASFISYMSRLGRNSWDINTPSTAKMVEQYQAKHKVYDFAPNGRAGYYKLYPGDVLYKVTDKEGGSGHVAIVKSYNADGSFTTIEGNTYCSSLNNDCVRYRSYYKNGTGKDSDNKSKSIAWQKILRW